MIIALDFDDTYTSDPDLFDGFIKLCHARNHEIYIVSARNPDLRNIRHIKNATEGKLEIFCTGAVPKRDYMERQGIRVDIWIDDAPETIVEFNLIKNRN